MYALNTRRSDVNPGPFQFPGAVDQTLLEATEQCVLCFLVVTVGSVGSQGLASNFSPCPDVKTSGFLPIFLNFDISDLLVPDASFGLILVFLGFTRDLRAALMLSRRRLSLSWAALR